MSNYTSRIPIRKKPRKLPVVKPSKYDDSSAIHVNKNYWKQKFQTTRDSLQVSESQRLSEVLPPHLYRKVCNALNIPIIEEKIDGEISASSNDDQHKERHVLKRPCLSRRYSFVIKKDLDSDTDVEVSPREKDKTNIHIELLSRPEREQITWPTHYLEPERDDEKSLIKRADDLTNKIANEFCEYMKQLGGDHQSKLFTPEAIKELFQIEFDTHCARGLCVVPKELHNITEKTANTTGHTQLTPFNIIEREITKDIRAERRPDRVQAFSRSLPNCDQWRAPRGDTCTLWRSSRYVPRDVVTLKTVWDGITNLKSVKEYCRWMIEHPEHKRAPYLTSLGLFDSAVLNARQNFENDHDLQKNVRPVNKPSEDIENEPIENIRQRLSILSDSKES